MEALNKETRILILSFHVLNWGYRTFACIHDASFLHLWLYDFPSDSRHDSARVHGVVLLREVIPTFPISVLQLTIYSSGNLLLIN